MDGAGSQSRPTRQRMCDIRFMAPIAFKSRDLPSRRVARHGEWRTLEFGHWDEMRTAQVDAAVSFLRLPGYSSPLPEVLKSVPIASFSCRGFKHTRQRLGVRQPPGAFTPPAEDLYEFRASARVKPKRRRAAALQDAAALAKTYCHRYVNNW